MDEGSPAPPDVGGLVRRLRRLVGTSQRDMARASGVPAATISHVERGTRELSVGQLADLARVAGARVALLDAAGHELVPMRAVAVRDHAGRRFPAHVDVELARIGWDAPPARGQEPWYTHRRQPARADDHRAPDPGDDPDRRRSAPRQAARLAAHVREQRLLAAGLLGAGPDPTPACSCPSGCDDMLLTGQSTRELQRVPHVPTCACRCDVA